MTVTKIITHIKPHLDEFAAIWMVKTFGGKIFEGIFDAPVEYWPHRGILPGGKTAEQLENEGVLLIGIGGGRFDEHASAGTGRKQGDCALTLIAKELGLENVPTHKKLLEYVVKNDLKGSGNGFYELASIATALNDKWGEKDPGRVLDNVMDILDAKYKQCVEFEKAQVEFGEKARMHPFRAGFPEQPLTMAIIESDNLALAKHARQRNVAILVQKTALGNVQIFIDKKTGLRMENVVGELRRVEAKMRRLSLAYEESFKEGNFMYWYYQPAGEMTFNGSKTAVEEPTRIPLEIITATVMQFAK